MNYSAPPPTHHLHPCLAPRNTACPIEAPPVQTAPILFVPPAVPPPIPFLVWTASGTPLFGAATTHKVFSLRESAK